MQKHMKKIIAFSILTCFIFCGNAFEVQAQQYQLTPLGNLGGMNPASRAYSINDSGEVVGASERENGPSDYITEAFYWNITVGIQALGNLPPAAFIFTEAFDINNSGQIVGRSVTETLDEDVLKTGPVACLWDHYTSSAFSLGDFPGGFLDSQAYGINDNGLIAGDGNVPPGMGETFLYENDTMTGLGIESLQVSGPQSDINNNRQIAGTGWSGSYWEAFLWENGSVNFLGRLPGANMSNGYDLNNSGQVVGESGSRAFLWESGTMMELDQIAPAAENCPSRAGFAINDHGQVVGHCYDSSQPQPEIPVLWDRYTGAVRLNTLLDASGNGWTVTAALDINSSGQIVGTGRSPSGTYEAILLTPVGPPEDADSDGYPYYLDCDENDPLVNPGASEVPFNGIDDDCNPATPDDDFDGDGYGIADDCDDNDPLVNPGASEVCDDGIDNDCSGLHDCNDSVCGDDPVCCVPTSTEEKGKTCRDGLDNDCDGYIDESDSDCGGAGDCTVTEGSEATCDDGEDNDCDGDIDCDDRNCRNDAACSGGSGDPEVCDDGIDNDGDGKVDCDDKKDCGKDPAC